MGEFDVFLCGADEIPVALPEIGRLREITFRRAGEGTGKPLDLDRFDRTYLHLFLWQRRERRICGAYRLGLTDRLGGGESGLYTGTLFDYDRRFLDLVDPAIELGRSFVVGDCQRGAIPLYLLWRGIGTFISRNPRYRHLFGPVSISGDYHGLSRRLMVEHIERHRSLPRLREWVRPRNPYRAARLQGDRLNLSTTVLSDLDEVSLLVGEIEEDAKGIPVLVSEYLKLGGRILGFNVDREFNDCIDGLVLVDLANAPHRHLKRYLGEAGAASFIQLHGARMRN